ncbi:hypothetical protein [Geminicoccus roseus]|uniref:hypothetical protein n=1 Tax=Geminicoccus roseus TaxID=404900 RepID=UPI000488D25C|nr:hypothetical protein [Geminicoccus roseus]
MANRQTLLDMAAGAALGVFVGCLAGLSASPVVGSVLTALLALLGAYFGLAGGRRPAEAAPQAHPRSIRMIAFSMGAVLATLGGLYLRTGDRLSPSLKERQAAWRELAFSEREAAQLVALETVGLNLFQDATVAAVPNPARQSSLFGDRLEACTSLPPRRFADEQAWVAALSASSAAWRQVAQALAPLDPARQAAAMQAVWRLQCPDT